MLPCALIVAADQPEDAPHLRRLLIATIGEIDVIADQDIAPVLDRLNTVGLPISTPERIGGL